MDAENNMAVLLGYEEVELTREVNGKKSVKVKCLPVRKLAEYAALFTLEPELIGLCTDLSPEEIDMLLADDSGKLFNKAHDLNYGPFSAWLKRKAEAAKLQAQIYGKSLPVNKSKTSGKPPAKM